MGQSLSKSSSNTSSLSASHFLWLCLSTVLIAAAGYMINDYFDMGIDTINKPHRVTIEKVFSRRKIISWHILLNVLAVLIAGYIFIHFLKLRFLLIQLVSIALLIIYSTSLKRKLFIGNFSIACLTALTVFSVGVYDPQFNVLDIGIRPVQVFWLYLSFAFFITLIREIVKDIEDMKGDSTQQCQTIPLVWGITIAKQIVYGIAGVLMALIVAALFLKANPSVYLGIIWVIGIVIPILFILQLLHKANTSKQFHAISSYLKWVTLLGILSMLFV